jgi:hypothetical protein
MNKNILVEKLFEKGLRIGRTITQSKTDYKQMNPNNFIIYNAVIKMFFINDASSSTYNPLPVEWSGDLDLSKDIKTLYETALELRNDLYIYYEMSETPVLIIKGLR